jgi:hypothetical protein
MNAAQKAARRMAVAALVGMLVGVGAPDARPAETREDAAQAAAASWLKLVDAGQYEESWEQAAALFKKALTSAKWKEAVGPVREPLGAVTSRKVKSRQYTEQLPGAPDGKYVVIQYDTVFANKASAVETVTPMLDTDGIWRVSGYFVR